jgi:hypothetical protein
MEWSLLSAVCRDYGNCCYSQYRARQMVRVARAAAISCHQIPLVRIQTSHQSPKLKRRHARRRCVAASNRFAIGGRSTFLILAWVYVRGVSTGFPRRTAAQLHAYPKVVNATRFFSDLSS